MSEIQARVRRREKFEELAGATIRALAGEADLHFRGHRLHRGSRALPPFAPHLHPADEDDFASFRGAADGLALRLARSDADQHRRLAPDDPVERAIFDLLEQFRVESLVPDSLPGVRRNLRHRHDAWSVGFHHGGLTDTARGLLVYTVAQVCRARVTGDPVLEETEDLLEATRAAIVPAIGHALAGLRQTRADQAAYAVHARAIAGFVADLLKAEGAPPGTQAASDAESDRETARSVFGLILETEGETRDRLAAEVSGEGRVVGDEADDYRIFTTAYDREVAAETLARRALLDADRARLDGLVAARGMPIGRLARELRRLLAQPHRDGWDGGAEEGLVDGRRLARLVASPNDHRIFRTDRIEPRADCALAFLVDCSGSMKAHSADLAVLLDVYSRALDAAGVAHEILGFTTGAWNGGRAHRDWVRAGRPAAPGRLNEALHIVFKPFDASWRRARRGIAALLRSEVFREGIDGEAVEWACARLAARDERRRVLLVVSDGSPTDSATALANDARFLDRHLRRVVDRHARTGSVEVLGVGVGLDLSPYYTRSHELELGASTGNSVFREVLELLTGRHSR